MAAGRHTLEAAIDGGATAWMEKIDVRGGESIRMNAERIEYGALSVYFLGGVGEFMIDGRPFERQPPITGARVPAGRHRVSCRMASDEDPRVFIVDITAGMETTIEYEVNREPVVTSSKIEQ